MEYTEKMAIIIEGDSIVMSDQKNLVQDDIQTLFYIVIRNCLMLNDFVRGLILESPF